MSVLSLGAIDRRSWSPDSLNRTRLVAELIGSAFSRDGLTASLERHVQFETMVADLAVMLANVQPAELDEAVMTTLGQLGEFMEVDRCFIDQFSADGSEFRVTHMWYAPGIPEDPAAMGLNLRDMVPWYVERMARGESLVFSSPDEIPVEAVPEREYARHAGIKSSAILPISAHGQVVGNIGFDAMTTPRTWSPEIVTRLQLVGHIIAAALKRWRDHASLQSRRARYRTLSNQLIQAREDGDRKIALDLHDGLNQELAALSIELGRVRGLEAGAEVTQRIGRVQERLNSISSDVRRLSHRLHPATLKMLGLPSALQTLCNDVARQGNLTVSAELGDVPELPFDRALNLYRIVQESLHNAMHHAEAKHVSVRLALTETAIELSVTDDGKGFEVSGAASQGGLGLISMEERARMIGGVAELESRPGAGTSVRVSVPQAQTA